MKSCNTLLLFLVAFSCCNYALGNEVTITNLERKWEGIRSQTRTLKVTARRLEIMRRLSPKKVQPPTLTEFFGQMNDSYGKGFGAEVPSEESLKVVLRKFNRQIHMLWSDYSITLDNANVHEETARDGVDGATRIVRTELKEYSQIGGTKQVNISNGFTSLKVLDLNFFLPTPVWMLRHFNNAPQDKGSTVRFNEGDRELVVMAEGGLAYSFSDSLGGSRQDKWFLDHREYAGGRLPSVIININSKASSTGERVISIADFLLIETAELNGVIAKDEFLLAAAQDAVVVDHDSANGPLAIRAKTPRSDAEDVITEFEATLVDPAKKDSSSATIRYSSRFLLVIALAGVVLFCVLVCQERWKKC